MEATQETPKTESSVTLIRNFFNCPIQELKALSVKDRAELAKGMSDGSYTY